MPVAVQPRRFTVDEYYAMDRAGVFAPDERVELLDGEILTMPPINSPRGGTVNRMTALFVQTLSPRAIVQVQCSVRLSSDSGPQPDFAILHPRDDFYSSRLAEPADVFALVEIADSSIVYDRERKLRAYARNGIGEYWIVNLGGQRVEVYRQPDGERHHAQFVMRRGDTVAFAAFPEDRFGIIEILGPPTA